MTGYLLLRKFANEVTGKRSSNFVGGIDEKLMGVTPDD